MNRPIIIISPFQFILPRGIENFSYNLANQLARKYKLIIYAWNTEHPVKKWNNWDKNIIIRKVPYSRYYQREVAQLFYYLWSIYDRPKTIICNFLWHGENIIYNCNRDIMIFHNPISQIPSRYNFTLKHLINNSKIVFDSKGNLSEFRKVHKSFYNCNIINTGVDSKYFKSERCEKTNNYLNLISISAFEKRKGISYLIKSMPILIDKIPEIRLVIIGSGAEKNYYEDLINKLRIQKYVMIKPAVDDTKPYLLDSDIYCLLSHGEGCPIGLLEAMACELPSIVSDKSPFDEIISMNEGIQVDRDDKMAILSAVLKLRKKNIRKKMGKKARQKIINKFTWEIVSSKFSSLIDNRNF